MQQKPKNFVTPEKTQDHAEILANRVRKRFAHLSRRFKREGIDCYRLYDWDIPEVRAVIDWYAGHLVIAEYAREQTSQQWIFQMAQAVAVALNIPTERVHIKRRRTNVKEGPRYSKMSSQGQRFKVRERNLNFWVNLDDFLDTGLYSDHRDTRMMIGKLASGQDFLNLYAYTGAFTCAAAFGKAKTTVTVDRSETYLHWAKDNLTLNGLWGPQHTLVQSDVMKFLNQVFRKGLRFTMALIDPPSFSQNHSSGVSFDINQDHPDLINSVLKVMVSGSLVFFSTNHQRFEPHLEGLLVRDLIELTPSTIPEDFRNRHIHRCWKMISL